MPRRNRFENVISGFVLTGGSGAIAHGKTAIYQTKLRARESSLARFGTSWNDIAFDIADTARKITITGKGERAHRLPRFVGRRAG